MSLFLGGSIVVALAVWYQVRQLGNDLDDREICESAPVVAGVVVGIASYVALLIGGSGPLAGMTPPLEVIARRSVLLASGVMIGLVALEGALWDLGRLENDWLLFPEQLRPDREVGQ